MSDSARSVDGAKDAIKIFAGNSNPALTAAVCKDLGVPVARADLRRFSDGEINVDIQENVRGGDVLPARRAATASGLG